MLMLNLRSYGIAVPPPRRCATCVGSTTGVTSAFYPSYLVKLLKQSYMVKVIVSGFQYKNPPDSIYPPLYYKNSGRQQKEGLGVRVTQKLKLLANVAPARNFGIIRQHVVAMQKTESCCKENVLG